MVTIRGHDSLSKETREIPFGRSIVEGPNARLAVDRQKLVRALALGCHTLRVTPDKPLVAEGEELTLLAMPLDPDLIAQPTEIATAASTTPMPLLVPAKLFEKPRLRSAWPLAKRFTPGECC
jgi:hypothetical protein